MPAIAGLRGTGNFATDERPKNFREMILWLDPNGDAPLTALLSKMASESVDDPEFAWWEEKLDAVRVQVNGAQTDSDTAIEVDAGVDGLAGALALKAGDLLLNLGSLVAPDNTALGELLFVASDPASDTAFTAVRGARDSTAAVIADNSILLKVGSVYGEGALSPKAISRSPTKVFNYTQIFKDAYQVTRTSKKTNIRTGDLLKNEKKRKAFDHAVSMEEAFMFGRKFEDTDSDGQPRRSTGGLNGFLTSNRTVFSGGTPFTEDNFINAVAAVFDRSGAGAGNDRLAFMGNGALTELNILARNSASSRIFHDESIKVYGMDLQRWILPQGVIYVRTHPLLNTDPILRYSSFIINPRGLKYRYVTDTMFEDNIETPGADHTKGQWLTECGLEVHHESTMAYLGNMNA